MVSDIVFAFLVFFEIRVIFWNMLYKDVGVCYDGNTKLLACCMGDGSHEKLMEVHLWYYQCSSRL